MKPNQAKETKQSVTNAKKESKQSETVAAAWGAMLQKLALITKANALNKTKQNKIDVRAEACDLTVILQIVINYHPFGKAFDWNYIVQVLSIRGR